MGFVVLIAKNIFLGWQTASNNKTPATNRSNVLFNGGATRRFHQLDNPDLCSMSFVEGAVPNLPSDIKALRPLFESPPSSCLCHTAVPLQEKK